MTNRAFSLAIATMAGFFLIAPMAACADQYTIVLRGSGSLYVKDGRILSGRANLEGDLWVITTTKKGHTIRHGGYLTGHKDGRVTLSETPVEGSYWSLQVTEAGRDWAPISVEGRNEGLRYLAPGEKNVALLSDDKGLGFRITVIAP